MIVRFLDEQYECTKAVKGTDYVHLYNESNNCIASFEGVHDFSLFTIENGDWSKPQPTAEERIAELEAQNADLANQVMMQSAVMDELLVEILPSLMGE